MRPNRNPKTENTLKNALPNYANIRETMTPNEIMDAVLDYEGIIDYGDTIRDMVKAIYGVDLNALSRNVSLTQIQSRKQKPENAPVPNPPKVKHENRER